jgi:hypothetical protein
METQRMRRERSASSAVVGVVLILLVSALRPRPPAITVVPLSYDPVHQLGAASERFWVLKAQGTAHYDMVLMGDSRVYRGLSPEAMEGVLQGYRILNYGFSGGGLNAEMYGAAEARLDPHSTRKSIVLGITPLTLTIRAEQNNHFDLEMQRPPDYVFMHLYWLPLLDSLAPLSAQDFSAAQADQPGPSQQPGYYLEFHDDGWVASYTVPEDPLSALPSYQEIFAQTPVSDRLVQELVNQTRQWTQRGIQVYAFRVPSSPAMVALEDRMSGFDEVGLEKALEAAGGIWFDLPLAPYHSYDGSHLTKQSAEALSIELAKLIKLRRK